jgi:hypothetical protein
MVALHDAGYHLSETPRQYPILSVCEMHKGALLYLVGNVFSLSRAHENKGFKLLDWLKVDGIVLWCGGCDG